MLSCIIWCNTSSSTHNPHGFYKRHFFSFHLFLTEAQSYTSHLSNPMMNYGGVVNHEVEACGLFEALCVSGTRFLRGNPSNHLHRSVGKKREHHNLVVLWRPDCGPHLCSKVEPLGSHGNTSKLMHLYAGMMRKCSRANTGAMWIIHRLTRVQEL